jgi:hypothetical protein
MTATEPADDTLWMLTIAPAIWATHFMLSYLTAAIWCAKFAAPNDSLSGVRTAIVCYTALALTGVAIVGWQGFRRHSYGAETTTHDLDSAEDRHRFLGFATLLLSGLSAVAILYVSLAAFFFQTCD